MNARGSRLDASMLSSSQRTSIHCLLACEEQRSSLNVQYVCRFDFRLEERPIDHVLILVSLAVPIGNAMVL